MISQTLVSLVNKTAGGDHEAFKQLLISHNPLIHWLIQGRTNCPEDAEDIKQEVSIRIFRHIPSLKRPEAFISWLRTIVIRECDRHIASRRHCLSIETIDDRERLFIETDSDYDPLAHLERLELCSALKTALKTLREPFRNIFYMRYCEDIRNCDIAAVTGVKAGTVSVTAAMTTEMVWAF